MIYLASAYSHPDSLIMKTRFFLAEEITAKLLQRGLVVYSPIVHCHELAAKYELPTTFEFWRRYNFGMLRLASRMYVFAPDQAWKKSVGVQGEIGFACEAGIPIQIIDRDGCCTDL